MLQMIEKLITSITLSRVAMWVTAIAVCIVFFTAYENRTRLFATVDAASIVNPVGLTFSIGAETEAFIKERVLADRMVVGISIMSADLRLNEAKSVFFFGDDQLLIDVDTEARKSGNNRLPLFSNLDDSNIDVIKLINGEFTCTPFTDTIMSRLYPELNKSVKTICRSSIPSYYGYFSGYVTIFLSEKISSDREAQLKTTTDKMATEIYFRDVIPTQKPEQPSKRKD